MTDIYNERAKFEAWVNESGLSATRHPSYPDVYQVPAIRLAWQAWLARAQSDKAVSVEALEGLCDEWDNLQVPGSADSYELGQFHAYRGAMRELRALIAKETGNAKALGTS